MFESVGIFGLSGLDTLGRIVLPKTTREQLGIYEGDQFEVITQDATIILVRHAPTCLACNDDTNVERMNKTFLCEVCRDAVGRVTA